MAISRKSALMAFRVERGFPAQGLLDGRVYSLVFTEAAKGIWVISFRKANKREVKRYEQEIKS